MYIEVGVHLEKSAGLDLMQAAAPEVRIGDQPLDARQGLKPQQHFERVHVIQEVADCFRDGALGVEIAEFLFECIVESPPWHCIGCGKFAKDTVENSVVE